MLVKQGCGRLLLVKYQRTGNRDKIERMLLLAAKHRKMGLSADSIILDVLMYRASNVQYLLRRRVRAPCANHQAALRRYLVSRWDTHNTYLCLVRRGYLSVGKRMVMMHGSRLVAPTWTGAII